MVQLTDILIFACIIGVIGQFWQLRNQAEVANKSVKQYCDNHNLQFIACARHKTRLCFFKRELFSWQTDYIFEFSGNGEDKSQGNITLHNKTVQSITTDVYKI